MVLETGKEDLIDYEDHADLEQSEDQEEDEEIAVEPVPTVPPKKVRNLPPHVFQTKTHPAPYFLRSGGILPVHTSQQVEVSHENYSREGKCDPKQDPKGTRPRGSYLEGLYRGVGDEGEEKRCETKGLRARPKLPPPLASSSTCKKGANPSLPSKIASSSRSARGAKGARASRGFRVRGKANIAYSSIQKEHPEEEATTALDCGSSSGSSRQIGIMSDWQAGMTRGHAGKNVVHLVSPSPSAI